MDSVDRKYHWDDVYRTKSDTEVSWYEETPALSLALIDAAAATEQSAIIDIGGGASRLVDCLLLKGYGNLTVLDISAVALDLSKARLGLDAMRVSWIAANVTRWRPSRRYDVWHDRAAYHFLIDTAEQAAYADTLKKALNSGGMAIIGTFAMDGPIRCSSLPVHRHDAASVHKNLGDDFALIDTRQSAHRTPTGNYQQFQFSCFRRIR